MYFAIIWYSWQRAAKNKRNEVSEKESYKEFISSSHQKQVRGRLFKLMTQHQIKLESLAREIGITTVTLRRFVVNEKDAAFDSLCKIIAWIDKNTNSKVVEGQQRIK